MLNLVSSRIEDGCGPGQGWRLRLLRTKKGWSPEELGFESALHRNYIGGIERVERTVEVVILGKLAKALGVRPRDLLP